MKNPRLLFQLALAATLGAQRVDAQQSPYRSLDVGGCAFADSVLGPLKDDAKGNVRGFYHTEKDSTFLITAADQGRLRVFLGIKFVGPRPTRSPAAQLNVMFRENDARKLDALPATPSVVIVLDDTATFELTSVVKGKFFGPVRHIAIPVSALIPPDDLVRVARAGNIAVRVGSAEVAIAEVALTKAERRALRKIYRVSVCPDDK